MVVAYLAWDELEGNDGKGGFVSYLTDCLISTGTCEGVRDKDSACIFREKVGRLSEDRVQVT